jgi:hypothetical protein
MTSVRIVFAAAIALVGAGTVSANAQDAERSVEQYTCRDIIRESDRDASIAFLHGYLLGKSGNSNFSIEVLSKQTDAFIDHCLDNPGDKAVDAMSAAKK